MTVKLGVIGPGTAFQQLHLPQLKARRDQLQISWLSSTNMERVEEAADLVSAAGFERPMVGTDFISSLEKDPVHAVLVAVPIAHTAAIVRDALDAGVHVFAEKPLAEVTSEARSLVSSATSAQRILFVGENFRYQRKFAAFDRQVASGVIGDPMLYFLNDLHFTPADGLYARTSWRQIGAHRGGYLLDGGTHIVAGMRSMVGRPIEAVHALTTAVHPEYLSKQSDTLLVNLRFAGGLIGHLALGYGTVDKESRTPKVYGTRGTLALTSRGIELWSPETDQILEPIDKSDTGFEREWDLFLQALGGDSSAQSRIHDDAIESVEDLRVLEAAIDSARSASVERLA